MARKGKNMFGGIMNLLILVMIIPIITSSFTSSDPTVQALMAIVPVMLILNAVGDFT